MRAPLRAVAPRNRSQAIRPSFALLCLFAVSLLWSGCTYDSSLGAVSCTEENSRSEGRVCKDGLWIDEGGLDVYTGDTPDVVPDVAPDVEPDTDTDDCLQGQVRCDGSCVDTQTNADHCGACGQTCYTFGDNSVAMCEQGSCQRTCDQGWADTDQDWYNTDDPQNSNGCETECTPTDDPTEICDGVDNNCDGNTDEGVTTRYYKDVDDDGYGLSGDFKDACAEDADFRAVDEGDCDDGDASVFPGATETCNGVDDNCDGTVDEGFDADGDGVTSCDGDCDDGDDTVQPGATETCNGVDDNCDGNTDEGVEQTFYADSDNDGYGNDASATDACSAPSDHVTDNTDCDDGSASVYPGATETCNGVDDNCDGNTDEGFDADGDGVTSCNGDCDDGDNTVQPGATETCNGVDDNCDGNTDEGVEQTFYADSDSDGYGNNGTSARACSAPQNHVSDNTDCDDGDNSVYPGATETCNGVDDDCDGHVDENVQQTFYADADNDGYGDVTSATDACSAPQNHVELGTDCEDGDDSVYPGATEVCNGVDDNCDGNTDEGVEQTFYADADNDGYGDNSSPTDACSAPGGYVSDNTDCADNDPDTNPGATEICDGRDNDCDSSTSDESSSSADSWCNSRHSNTYSCIIGTPHNEICCERDGANIDCDDEVDCTNGIDDDDDGDTDCDDSDCGGMFCESGPNCQNNVCVTP